MNLEKSFGAPARAERDGHWFKAVDVFKDVPGFIDADDPAEIKLAGAGMSNPNYLRKVRDELSKSDSFRKIYKGRDKKGRDKEIDSVDFLADIENTEAAERHTIAETVVLDWRGFTDASGADIPYTPEYMVTVFKQFPRLFYAIRQFVSDIDNFRIESLEDDVKN
jgi:hypothetical protein